MNTKFAFFSLLLLSPMLMASMCKPIPVPEPEPCYHTCDTACANLKKLGCKTAETTPEGATCVQVCKNTKDLPPAARWNLPCLSEAKACDACDPK